MRKIITGILIFFCAVVFGDHISFAESTKEAARKQQQPAQQPTQQPAQPVMPAPPYPPYYPPGSPMGNPVGGMPPAGHSHGRLSLQYADTDNDNLISPQELEKYETEKFALFDTDKDGKLSKKEMIVFDKIDLKLSKGGERLEELSQEEKDLYRDWRGYIPVNDPNAAKCFPDKVCDSGPAVYPSGQPPAPAAPPPQASK